MFYPSPCLCMPGILSPRHLSPQPTTPVCYVGYWTGHFWGLGLAFGGTCKVLGRLLVNICPAPLHQFISLAGEVSSISGSDSESSDVSSESELLPSASDSPETPLAPRSHKVLLRNAKGQLISAYRCVLSTGKVSHSQASWERDCRESGWHWGVDICPIVLYLPFREQWSLVPGESPKLAGGLVFVSGVLPETCFWCQQRG